MKNKWIFPLISVFLSVAVIFGSAWFIFNGSGSSNDTDLCRVALHGDELIPDIYTVSSGTLPDGWDKTYPYVFLRDGDKSTCLATEGGNNGHLCVKHTGEESWLGFCGRNGASILTLPEITEEDFFLSFDLSFDAFKFPFGLAVGMNSDPEKANEATVFSLSSQEKSEGVFIPRFSTYKLTAEKGQNYTEKISQRKDFTFSDYFPELIIRDNKTGSETIPSFQSLNIKVFRYNGVYYFYCNDLLITEITDPDKNGRIGFYSDCEGREVKVKNLKLTKIDFADKTDKKSYSALSLEAIDFTDGSVSDLPTGWTVKNDEGSALVSDTGLTLKAEKGSTALVLPAAYYKNTLLEVTLRIPSEGAVGIVDNVPTDADNLNGTFAVFDIENSTLRHYNSENSNETDIKSYQKNKIKGLSLKAGDKVTFKVYRINGTSYFYIDDTFISYTKSPDRADLSHNFAIYADKTPQLEVLKVAVSAEAQTGVANGIKAMPGSITLFKTDVKYHIVGSLDKNDILYLGAKDSDSSPLFGFVYAEKTDGAADITLETKGAKNLKAEKHDEDENLVSFISDYIELSPDKPDVKIVARPYLMIKKGDEPLYFYGKTITVSPAKMASDIYPNQPSDIKALFDDLFKDCDDYIGKYEKYLTFSLFSDFHYKKMMYSTSVADMQSILDRANKAGASFILSAGDFCNNFTGSPELMKAFLQNNYSLPAYNIYGNHELESAGNGMDVVTPLLTNDENVVWGTRDGKIGDGSIGYYYFDREGFRIICTDTNYSYNPSTGVWEHNTTASYGPPSGNTQVNALGPEQLLWLEQALTDAAENAVPCIIVSHATFSPELGGASADAAKVRSIFAKVNELRRGTVLLAINGHYHTNRIHQSGDILYLDMNTTRNGVWRGTGSAHYTDAHTFEFVDYDSSGTPVSTEKISLNSLSMGQNTWFFEDPLSAIVKISPYGRVVIEGQDSRWIYGVNPENTGIGEEPKVSSGTWELLK